MTDGVDVRSVDVPKLQRALQRDDCYLPWHGNPVSALSAKAKCSAEVVRSGVDRNMPCRFPLGEPDCKLPDTLVKHYKVVGTDTGGTAMNSRMTRRTSASS